MGFLFVICHGVKNRLSSSMCARQKSCGEYTSIWAFAGAKLGIISCNHCLPNPKGVAGLTELPSVNTLSARVRSLPHHSIMPPVCLQYGGDSGLLRQHGESSEASLRASGLSLWRSWETFHVITVCLPQRGWQVLRSCLV